MPIYIYETPRKQGKHIEVLQSMKEEHTYKDEEGVEWRRVFFKLRTKTQTGKYRPLETKNDFMNKKQQETREVWGT